MKDKKGFTLVELLAVIVILGILSTVGVISYNRYLDKTRKQSYDTMFESIYDASQNYMMDKGALFKNKCSYSIRYGLTIGSCNDEEKEFYGCKTKDIYGCRDCDGCANSQDFNLTSPSEATFIITRLTTSAKLVENGYLEELIDPATQGRDCNADVYAYSSNSLSSSSEKVDDYFYVIKLSCKKNTEVRRYSVSKGMEVLSQNTD